MVSLSQDNRYSFVRTKPVHSISSVKTVVRETVVELEGDSESDDFKPQYNDSSRYVQYGDAKPKSSEPPVASNMDKLREIARLAATRTSALTKQNRKQNRALSVQGKYVHDLVMPYNTWWGKNQRVVLGQCLPRVSIRDVDGKSVQVVNGAAQNYAGTYDTSPLSEELQRLALDRLPIVDAGAIPLLAEATDLAMADFVHADFSVSTTTGYASNYVALPALIDKNTLVVLDEYCHNSIFTGIYLGQPGAIRKLAHNDMNQLEQILRATEGQFFRTILVFEGLYSMEGDIAPLGEIRRLKGIYDMVLYCDEAHSIGALGTTGRGCIEYWNEQHPANPLPKSFIDIRTGTFSKAIGGVGGYICGRAKFEDLIKNHSTKIQCEDESLSTSQMVQCLWVLNQPSKLIRHLHRLADMSRFCREELRRFGIYVYGNDDSCILPVHCGRPTLTAKLSNILRKKGVLTIPISAPAVPMWQTRVRICLSASHTDEEINKLIDAVIMGCKEIGICKRNGVSRQLYAYEASSNSYEQEELEAQKAFNDIRALISTAADHVASNEQLPSHQAIPNVSQGIIQCGHDSRSQYGLCCGSSRWGLSFPPHFAVENLIAKWTSSDSCLTYPDSNIGLSSTIAALSRPLLGYQSHYMLLPVDVPQPVNDGTIIASPKGKPEIVRYRDIGHLRELITDLSISGKKPYFTIYVHVSNKDAAAQILPVLSKLNEDCIASLGMTILVNSPSYVLQALELCQISLNQNMELLVTGSFYRTLGLPGGYLAGSERLIEELRYTNRGYMFTTSPQPFMMGMIKAELEARFERE